MPHLLQQQGRCSTLHIVIYVHVSVCMYVGMCVLMCMHAKVSLHVHNNNCRWTSIPYYLKLWSVSYKHWVSFNGYGKALTVTKLNVQYSALHIISCYQNSPLVYITTYNQHVKCLLHLVASVKYHWKEIITWTTTWGNTVISYYICMHL